MKPRKLTITEKGKELMSTRTVIEGMSILLPYYDNPNGFDVGADHDVIYMYGTDRPLSNEDLHKMKNLGWFQENCLDDGDFAVENYDPSKTWQVFV
jgi:hypothetical protein